MLAQSPQVCFGASETRAMHTGLLSRADTDGLSIDNITNGVGLGELERDPGDEHVTDCRFWKFPALCNDLCEIITSHRTVVAALFHAYAKDLSRLGGLRFVGWVNLNHGIFALFLFLQDLQRFRFIGGCNHTIRYFSADEFGSGHVYRIG